VRAAIAMAINRESLVRNVFDSLGAVALGPFVRSMSVADTTVRQIPYDPTRAARILDTLGWRMPSIGEIRMKGGRLLEFSVLLPNSSQTRERAALLLQEDLRRIGVSLIIDDPDHATFASRRAAHDFDSYFGTRLVTPSPSDLRIQWGAGTIVGNASQNHGWYENRAMTAIIDSAIATTNPERRRAFFKRACQLITDDVAAVWLYEPRNIAAVKTNATVTGLNAWSWWDDIRNWRVGTAAAAARQ
jgi:peptide/nickel transport system substrate-binding protein